MAITRKPAAAKRAASVDVDELIQRGGSSPTATETAEDRVVAVILRLPATMIRSIDMAVKRRPVRIPRHTWLLEAIHEKLTRDSGGSSPISS